MANRGFFLISDITGYTAFLTGTEMDHANDIIANLLRALLEHHQPPFTVAKLEGDAIFAYLADGLLASHQSILDTVESMYAAFRKVQEIMRLNTTCTCSACTKIPTLDLKFFIHHGSYIIQDLGGNKELSGPDVILVHRLLKNSVNSATGLEAYALFTQAACQQIAIPAFDASMRMHEESYEHLGAVKCCLYDLHAFWEVAKDQQKVFVTPEAADLTGSFIVEASPLIVWDLFTTPATRAQLMNAISMNVSDARNGVIAPGATLHCDHGTEVTYQQILDWQPHSYITSNDRFQMPLLGTTSMLTTMWFKPQGEGTEFVFCIQKIKAKDPRRQGMANLMWKVAFTKELRKIFGQKIKPNLLQLVAERVTTTAG